jgi:hypothetical protein
MEINSTLRYFADLVGTRPTTVTGFISPTDINARIASAITLALTISAIIAVIMIIMGGINLINANGDPARQKTAQAVITNAVIGLVITFSAYAILLVVASVLGIPSTAWTLTL